MFDATEQSRCHGDGGDGCGGGGGSGGGVWWCILKKAIVITGFWVIKNIKTNMYLLLE